MRRTILILLLIAVSASSSFAQEQFAGAPPSSIRLFAGPSICFPVTSADDNPTLGHFGWGVGGGAELQFGRIIAARLGADILWIGPSSVSPEGVLYRAWNGLRLSLEAGGAFAISRLSLALTAGASLTAADYRGTSLIFAYPSILARAELSLPAARNALIRIGLPVEIMLRGQYLDISPGLSASFAYAFPLGGAE